MRDRDLQASWVGKCREEYYGDDEEEMEFDEEFAYESWRDMRYEDEIEAKQGL